MNPDGISVKVKGYDEDDTTRFVVEGNNGELFRIDDDISGSLFTIADISGLPVFEVAGDGRLTMGGYNQNTLIVDNNKFFWYFSRR